ncbi:PREDICTED: late embryogenesis abundant protein At1g64065 [Nelumbo nucifera]|uniref:Late embryogenesis abundant protein LEA-2 subgroup domain-containing protein n=2 Tax=Nelumbo nucifera TaxID=4432 RepID=A0A822XFB9_NELNU|nr:PREDICTED: late embryogenesis abundant protein At1g64065 [Nelumbo nucifera]DAD19070.1 TPA_asm: hypothetical protein HUJ06_020533 [Nelumbo nucifera]
MAEKDQTNPLAPAVGPAKSDEESASLRSKEELRHKRNIKCFVYILAFAVFQTIIILVFALTVLKIKTPSVRMTSVTVENLSFSNNASFTMKLIGEVAVKNKNFGHFKFDNSTVTVSYQGTTVGQALVPKARAKARKTTRMNVTMEVNSEQLSGNSNLRNDIDSGTLILDSYAKLSGKVHLMKVMKKRKTAEMNCTITLNFGSKSIQGWNCD